MAAISVVIAVVNAASLADCFFLFRLAVLLEVRRGVVFEGAPRLRFFIHPLIKPLSLAIRRPCALRGMGGGSVLN